MGRSSRSRGLRLVSLPVYGLEGALEDPGRAGGQEGEAVREDVSTGPTACTGTTGPLLPAQSPRLPPAPYRTEALYSAQLAGTAYDLRANLPKEARAGIISSLLKRTFKSREGLASLGRAP